MTRREGPQHHENLNFARKCSRDTELLMGVVDTPTYVNYQHYWILAIDPDNDLHNGYCWRTEPACLLVGHSRERAKGEDVDGKFLWKSLSTGAWQKQQVSQWDPPLLGYGMASLSRVQVEETGSDNDRDGTVFRGGKCNTEVFVT